MPAESERPGGREVGRSQRGPSPSVLAGRASRCIDWPFRRRGACASKPLLHPLPRGEREAKLASAFDDADLAPLPSWERGWGEGASNSRILISTPSRFCITSLFQKRSTTNPCDSSHASRMESATDSLCWPPSTSTTSFASKQTKSTMYFPIGCCRLNLLPTNRCARSCRQITASASVGAARMLRAKDFNTIKAAPSPAAPPR